MDRQNKPCRKSALINVIFYLMHSSALNKTRPQNLRVCLLFLLFIFYSRRSVQEKVIRRWNKRFLQALFLSGSWKYFRFSLFFFLCTFVYTHATNYRSSVHALNTLTYTFSSCIMGFIFLDFLFSIYLNSGCALVQIKEKEKISKNKSHNALEGIR